MKKILYIILAIHCSPVFSQIDEERLIKNSLLSLSAFQCSIVATDSKERERLFNLGLQSGRNFVELVRNKPESYKKAHSKIPMVWSMVVGPTSDFILGQIYSQFETEIYKKYEQDEKLWNLIKDNMYRDKNCALIK
jgi:hypothetical protein